MVDVLPALKDREDVNWLGAIGPLPAPAFTATGALCLALSSTAASSVS
jgi:hypothetical protein